MNESVAWHPRSKTNVCLAYFVDLRNVHDAATDLCLAGFVESAINITEHLVGRDVTMSAHSWRWRIRRYLAHDRHRRGADQITGDASDPHAFTNPVCTHISLGLVLAQLEVSQAVIDLLQRDADHNRIFMLIDAVGRVREASRILQRNRGQLRTEFLQST